MNTLAIPGELVNLAPIEQQPLASLSPRDNVWDTMRGYADAVAVMLHEDPSGALDRLGQRVDRCVPWLRYGERLDESTGEAAMRLEKAFFCRVRSCPVCQWRRSLMWKARAYEAIPQLAQAYPAARWIFLPLTVRNCAPGDLRQTLRAMSGGWNRLREHAEMRDVLGWVRGVEVTRKPENRTAHPHFHNLLLVKSTYFRGDHYITQARWTAAWRKAMRLDYDPIVDVRAVRSRGEDGIRGAVAETLKYAVAPADMVADADWFREVVRQTHRTRAVASGGVLKDLLRDEENGEELLLLDDQQEPDDERLRAWLFNWQQRRQQYIGGRVARRA